MKLASHEIHAAYYAVAACRRALNGRPAPPALEALWRRLELVIRYGEVTRSRQLSDASPEESDAESNDMELIGTRMAAEMLGMSHSTVLRRAADLDGQIVGKQFVFPRHVVAEYAEAMKENL